MQTETCANVTCGKQFETNVDRHGDRRFCSKGCSNAVYQREKRARDGKKSNFLVMPTPDADGFVYDGQMAMSPADYQKKLNRARRAWNDGVEWSDLESRFGAPMIARVSLENPRSQYTRVRDSGDASSASYRISFKDAWKTKAKTSSMSELYTSFYTGG